jgi:hypothetical protein
VSGVTSVATLQYAASESLPQHRQPPALVIVQAEPSAPQLHLERAVLFAQESDTWRCSRSSHPSNGVSSICSGITPGLYVTRSAPQFSDTTGPADVRQHAQVRAHHHERQSRQHDQRHFDVRDSVPALRLARRLRPTLGAAAHDHRHSHAGVCRRHRAGQGLVLPRAPQTSDASHPRMARVRASGDAWRGRPQASLPARARWLRVCVASWTSASSCCRTSCARTSHDAAPPVRSRPRPAG